MQLDNNQLHALLTFLEGSDIQELKLEGEDFRLEVRRNLPAPNPVPAPAAAALRADLVEVTAPMVGTFYRAASPGDPPFVELGSVISVGQTVCILEAMKLMNELEAEMTGQVVEILVENGTPVEFGQVLMRVKPG
ncbi:MAG: acetyl-CoA carboxylase biotin carboxyl carrier protein [Cyanobium sp.]|nr:MAG: acetyl-CoA carboxylase biotin carboxyl carrier protein [Cyanobium sp.]